MPVLASSTSTSSPSRRLGLSPGSYASSSYTSSYGSYSRSSSVFSSGARTASLDRSPYTSYKYSSPSYTTTSSSSSSATRDYSSSSRPPLSTRNTSSSFYRYSNTPCFYTVTLFTFDTMTITTFAPFPVWEECAKNRLTFSSSYRPTVTTTTINYVKVLLGCFLG